MAGWDAWKVVVYVPEDRLEGMMAAVNDSMAPVYPGYDYVFSHTVVEGTWRPLSGSSPYKGTIGTIERARESRLEFTVRDADLRRAIARVMEVHPYEQPAVDVYPVMVARDLIDRVPDVDP